MASVGIALIVAGLFAVSQIATGSTGDNIAPAGNETETVQVEDDVDEQAKAVDNMPTVVGRQPDIAGPGAEQCREPLDNAFVAVLQTDQYMEFAYISEHVREVYCNDVHVVVPGIPYNHIGYVLHSHPDRVYLNPAAYNLYSASEDLAILLFHEARHLEQYKECKADRSLCMTSEDREIDAQRFGHEMWDKLFPIEDQNPVIIIPPASTTAMKETIFLTLDYWPIN